MSKTLKVLSLLMVAAMVFAACAPAAAPAPVAPAAPVATEAPAAPPGRAAVLLHPHGFKACRHPHRVAVAAPGGDDRAARDRVPRCIGPLDA